MYFTDESHSSDATNYVNAVIFNLIIYMIVAVIIYKLYKIDYS